MSYFAQIEPTDDPNKFTVVQVISIDRAELDTGAWGDPSLWLQTSYNTRGGIHYGQDGKPDGGIALRANYAGVGFTYDKVNDVFYAPAPYPSWILGSDWLWNAPSPCPKSGDTLYVWDEATTSWVLLPPKAEA